MLTPCSQNTSYLVDSYNALISITGEGPDAHSLDAPKERQFAPEYLDDNIGSERSIKLRKRILTGSRRFLEEK